MDGNSWGDLWGLSTTTAHKFYLVSVSVLVAAGICLVLCCTVLGLLYIASPVVLLEPRLDIPDHLAAFIWTIT